MSEPQQQQHQQQEEEGGRQPSEPGGEPGGERKKTTTAMSLSMETAIASVAGAAIGIGSSFLPGQYALPLALGAAIVVPKKNKGFSTALILVLSWLIMFTIFYQ